MRVDKVVEKRRGNEGESQSPSAVPRDSGSELLPANFMVACMIIYDVTQLFISQKKCL